MILVSSALPKSASTLIADYQEDLLEVSDQRSGQVQFREAFDGRYVHRLGPVALARLGSLNLRHGSLILKTHLGPRPLVRALISSGLAKATVCYRDPRDILLSAIDHGERSRKGLVRAAFTEVEDVAGSIPKVKGWLRLIDRWERFEKAHFVRYEDLMDDHGRELRKMIDYLGWDVSESTLEEVVRKRKASKASSPNFNTGRSQRYRSEMTPAEIEVSTNAFRGFLINHGYDVSGS